MLSQKTVLSPLLTAAHRPLLLEHADYVGSEAHGVAHFTSGHHQGTLYRGAVARGKVSGLGMSGDSLLSTASTLLATEAVRTVFHASAILRCAAVVHSARTA